MDGAWHGDYKMTIYCGVLTFTCGKSSVHDYHLAQTIERQNLTITEEGTESLITQATYS
jgi:hypothetical protein